MWLAWHTLTDTCTHAHTLARAVHVSGFRIWLFSFVIFFGFFFVVVVVAVVIYLVIN